MIDSDPKHKVPKGAKRSNQWTTFKKHYFVKYGKVCALCGSKSKVQLHHILVFHEHPELELEESNVIPLCEDWRDGLNCHLSFGHLGNFKSFNADVRDDVAKWRKKILFRPK